MTDLRITSPCAADWNAMTPAAAGRHCAACGKDVIDVTCLEPAAREFALKRLELAIASGRNVCVRARADSTGRVAAQTLNRRVLTSGMATVLAISMAGCQGDGPVTPVNQTSIAASAPVSAAPPAPTPTHEAAPPISEQPIRMGDFAVAPPKNELIMGKMCMPAPAAPVAAPTTPVPSQAPHCAQ